MALWTVRPRSALAQGAILAPERYDPRREALSRRQGALRVGEVAQSVCELVTPRARDSHDFRDSRDSQDSQDSQNSRDSERYLIIDTSHSREGILYNRLPPTGIESMGSAKKLARPGDVLISRLRPYLRQIAYVDADVPGLDDNVRLACSTEYFVLRSADGDSIAFLVPFFLSAGIQHILAAAQEGGHHPRVSTETILNLPLPPSLVAQRAELGGRVEAALRCYRQAERELRILADNAAPELSRRI